MRIVVTIVLIASLAGCAAVSVQGPPCEPHDMPAAAKVVSTPRMDLATWPPSIPAGFTGCQRIWYGSSKSPASMRILVTSHFEGGRLTRLIGKEPEGLEYDCRYREGVLQESRSLRPERCPDAAVIEANS
jgi:hypothetical protein